MCHHIFRERCWSYSDTMSPSSTNQGRKLKDSTQRDPILAMVYQLTQQGWPHQRRHVPRLVWRYWDFRDELSTDDGLLLKGPRLIIPGKLQEEYLSHLHKGHLSSTKVQENARQHMYWDWNRCGYRGLHQAMPGVYQTVSSSQGAPPTS